MAAGQGWALAGVMLRGRRPSTADPLNSRPYGRPEQERSPTAVVGTVAGKVARSVARATGRDRGNEREVYVWLTGRAV
jgi:hypothetical protein